MVSTLSGVISISSSRKNWELKFQSFDETLVNKPTSLPAKLLSLGPTLFKDLGNLFILSPLISIWYLGLFFWNDTATNSIYLGCIPLPLPSVT